MEKSMRPWEDNQGRDGGSLLSLAVLAGSAVASSTQRDLEGGTVVTTQAGDSFRLENQAIGAKWSVTEGRVNSLLVTDRMHGTELASLYPLPSF
jgi:hypothetical protein